MSNKFEIKECPLKVEIRTLLQHIANGDFQKALQLLRRKVPFPGTTGCMCSAPCSINFPMQFPEIGEFEYFLVENELASNHSFELDTRTFPKSDKKIAIVGSGPSGMIAAHDLLRMGHSISIFDALPRPGGIPAIAISDERLPKHILFSEMELIKRLGAEFNQNFTISDECKLLRNLRNEYNSVLIAIGAHRDRKFKIAGTDTNGVIYSMELIHRLNNNDKFPIADNVTIIGDTDEAVYCSILFRKLKKNVTLISWKRLDNMQANIKTIIEAIGLGVEFLFLHMPRNFISENGSITRVEFERLNKSMSIIEGETVEENAASGSIHSIDTDLVIIAGGRMPDIDLLCNESIKKNKMGYIDIDDYFSTHIDGVFATGDCIGVEDGYIGALHLGRSAAGSVHRYLSGMEPVKYNKVTIHKKKKRIPNVIRKSTNKRIDSLESARKYALKILQNGI